VNAGGYPPVGSLGAPIGGFDANGMGVHSSPGLYRPSVPSLPAGQRLIPSWARAMAPRGGGARVGFVDDTQSEAFGERPIASHAGWGRAGFDVGRDGLNMGFGPVNPHGLESSSWMDVARGVGAAFMGGVPGLISHGVNRWPSHRNPGASGSHRAGASAVGSALGLPAGLGGTIYDIYSGVRGGG
jgi:hypothetical protein